MDNNGLINEAWKILDLNWRGNYTIPSQMLYPHQWSWDSAFVSIGNSKGRIKRSIKELQFLFNAQWKNGMIPHIVFNDDFTSYFPSSDFYNSHKSIEAPIEIKTSGMTQPAIHAIAAYDIYQNHPEKKSAKEFLRDIFPKLMYFHEYLMMNRDPEKSGAITIMHPWESGMDNSPVWDEALRRLEISKDLKYKRKDLANVSDEKQRPDNATYDAFIFLLLLMRDNNYDHGKMYRDFPFKIKSSTFTSLLYVSNRYMLEIAEILNEDDQRILEWQRRIKENFEKNFCLMEDNDPLYYDYDLISKKHIIKQTVGSIVPIYSGLPPKKKVGDIVEMLGDSKFCGTSCHVMMVPSIGLHESEYTPQLYWRGPIWINVNWLIWRGLQNYGYSKKAEQIRNGVIELVRDHGFYEYFDVSTGVGYGGKNFSWTASLLIDMLMNPEPQPH